MRNPWLKKNPFMSLWLSGANSVMGAARGRVTAEARRQSAAMMAEATRQTMRFWTAGTLSSPSRKKKSR